MVHNVLDEKRCAEEAHEHKADTIFMFSKLA